MDRTVLKSFVSSFTVSLIAVTFMMTTSCENVLSKPVLEASVANPESVGPPVYVKPPLSKEQLKQLSDAVAGANTMLSCRKLDNQITIGYKATAISHEAAEPLLQQILAKEKQLIGPDNIAIAYTLYNVAGCSSPDTAFKLGKEVLAMATAKLPPKDKFVLQVRYSLARSVAVEKRGAAALLSVSADCPHCHNNRSVVPTVGFVPMRQKDHSYLFVNRGCGEGGPDWYCRKCSGSFYPYSTEDLIMDEYGLPPAGK